MVVAVLDILDRLLDPLFVVVVAFDLSSLPMLFPTRKRKDIMIRSVNPFTVLYVDRVYRAFFVTINCVSF